MLAPLASVGDKGTTASQPLLLFVHIPKTAGTTLGAVLRMHAPRPRDRSLTNVYKGGGGVNKVALARFRRGRFPDLSKLAVVRGHVPLVVADYLQESLPEGREVRAFTFLRDPVERTLSHFFAVRETGRTYGRFPLDAEATLDQALEEGYLHDNLQTRMISGVAEPFDEVDDAMLLQAKRNLTERLSCFGLSERFDESLVLAKLRLGLRRVIYRSSGRVNPRRPRGGEIPADMRRTAEEANRYDIALYRHAQEIFDALPERGQPVFELELAALRAARADGELVLDAPPPDDLEIEQVWRLALESRAELLRLEHERATGADRRRLTAAEARAAALERALEQTVARLEVARAKRARLARRVERLRAEP